MPKLKGKKLWEEFRSFAFKGNVVDLAVGVIIGGAFGKIVTAMVQNILMPLIAVVMPGDRDYEDWKYVLNGSEITYGKFLSETLNFFVVALVLWLFFSKFLGALRARNQQEAAAPPPAPPPTPEDVLLLREIRDLLAKQK